MKQLFSVPARAKGHSLDKDRKLKVKVKFSVHLLTSKFWRYLELKASVSLHSSTRVFMPRDEATFAFNGGRQVSGKGPA